MSSGRQLLPQAHVYTTGATPLGLADGTGRAGQRQTTRRRSLAYADKDGMGISNCTKSIQVSSRASHREHTQTERTHQTHEQNPSRQASPQSSSPTMVLADHPVRL